MCHTVYYQNGFVATHALGQMTIGQMSHCWYQWTNDDHFIYQGFPNSAKRWEAPSPILLSRKTNIYIYIYIYIYIWNIVTACVLITLANLNPAIFYVPRGTENLISCSRQMKSPDNSHLLLMFNNNTHVDFRTAWKHVLIPSYFIQVIEQDQNVTKLNINWLFG